MADLHLQINPDGSTEMRKTVLWPSKTEEREVVLNSIFSKNDWNVVRLFNVSGSHWKVEVSCQDIQYKINLYIGSIRDEARQDDEFKMQLGNSYPTEDEDGWITLILGIYAISNNEEEIVDYILSAYNSKNFDFSGNPSIRGTRTKGLQMARILGFYKTDKSYLFRPDFIYYYIQNLDNLNSVGNSKQTITEYTPSDSTYLPYLTALRTKPFMLLAGISGTGKSRIVREFAFKSCPPALQDAEGTTPGNYCMIEVKPNWHDSTEILGYYSNISKKYHFTKFVKFLVKAMMFPDVPFFVCLDEMNLAPVEQYFAEFLSVLETRKKDKETEIIQSGVLVAPEYFAPILNAEAGNGYVAKYLCPEINVNIPYDIYKNTSLATVGLTLPDNVFIIGTVNMDDTTHQFSRKVIDRAMTIEMNGGKLKDMFNHSADLQYLPEDQIMKLSDFKPKYVNADEVMKKRFAVAKDLKEKLVAKLDKINDCLKSTPFQVSYRVLNELCIYAGVLLDDGEEIDNAISKAVDQITLMKILPRIEGDADMFVVTDKEQIDTSKINNKLEQLQEILGKDSASGVKLEEMKERLKNSSFTRFWP